MAALLGSSSSVALFASRNRTLSASSSAPSLASGAFVSETHVRSSNRCLGGGVKVRRGRREFRVAAVATEVSSVEEAQRQAAKESQRPVYPFAAIVGQDEMKLCLLLNVIDPKIGGVMIMGDRGTGKSTTVRSLVDLLPEIRVVAGDPFNSDPEDPESMGVEVRELILKGEKLPTLCTKINMVDLPLGATEDRVCGTIDIEKALTEGVKAFEPGLLAKANRGILYVDEVNLLDDHLVDVLLDSAASGWNTVEREGISISHPARFILIGSGNPEEGELRPQLLDRFEQIVLGRPGGEMEAHGGGGGGLKGYWRRKQYNQLFSGGGGGNRWRETRRRRVVLGGAPAGGPRGATKPRPRRFWRIKVAPKLQVFRQAISPRRLLTRLRDAYVRMMMSFASSGGPFSGGGLAYYGVHNPVAELSRPPLKEYDDKMILEIYKSLVAQKHLIPAAAGRPTEDPLRSTILHRPH